MGQGRAGQGRARGAVQGATHFNCRDTAAAFVPPHLVKQQFVELISYPRTHTHTHSHTPCHIHTATTWSMEHTSESKTLCVLLTLTPSQIYVHTYKHIYECMWPLIYVKCIYKHCTLYMLNSALSPQLCMLLCLP